MRVMRISESSAFGQSVLEVVPEGEGNVPHLNPFPPVSDQSNTTQLISDTNADKVITP